MEDNPGNPPGNDIMVIDLPDIMVTEVTVQTQDKAPSSPGTSYGVVCDPMVQVDDDDVCDDEEEESIRWDLLPDLVLANVASYLREWDKSEMSLVCKHWNRVILCAPRLWRHRTIRLRGGHRDRHHLNFATLLGRYLNRLHLSSGLRSLRHVRKFQRNFTTILAELYRQNVQLEELSLTELKFHHHFRGTPGGYARKGVIRSARRFLGKQRKLRYLDLNYGGMTCEEGTSLLAAAADKSATSMKALDIEELFRPGEAIHTNSEFSSTLPRFINLTQLTLNYAALSDSLLYNMAAQPAKGKLEYLHVRCIRGENIGHIIGTPAWRAFANTFPGCTLEFSLVGIIRLSDIQRVLTPQMPVHIISILGHNDDSFQPDRTLKYISRYLKRTLEKLTVDVTPCYKMYARGFIDVIRDSSRLRHVEVRGRIRWHVIRDVFEFLDVNFVRKGVCPTLTTLRMMVTSTPLETYEDEAFVIEEFRPVFSRFDLMYELVIEPMFFPLPLEYRAPHRALN
ncbi:F-box only protein 39-like [Diadema setosum]|uniref:F-box only protein 39-like n=1 Tax=Diadema setosum TaxID=31175 RepID=UPI003B3BD5D5